MNDYNNTPLHKAVLEDDAPRLRKLLRSGEDSNRLNALGLNPLQLARYLGKEAVLRQFDPCRSHPILLGNLHDDRVCKLTIEEFERATDIRYRSHPRFSSIEELASVHYQLVRMERKFAVENRWLGVLFRPQIMACEMASVAIKWIDDSFGYGLFATATLPAWSYLGEYTGHVRSPGLLERRDLDYTFEYPAKRWWLLRYTMDAEREGNELRYINHSDDPNAEAVAVLCEGVVRIAVRTLRTIEAGEQISIHYGERYWRAKGRRGEQPLPM